MQRAIELSVHGLGNVSPNPLVGCVIAHQGRIIGEGWHRKFGEGHAEVNALNSVVDKSLLSDSTLYVTLEPCAHHGKTPPCSLAIVQSGIRRVVVAAGDPFPAVSGKGIQQLRDAGIEVVEGVLADEARFANRRFLVNQEQKRPYIILKWAQSADGFMDAERSSNQIGSIRISGDDARRLSHRWRSEEDAILVGVNTVLVDNPQLTCRYWSGRNPVRIVLDPHKKLSGSEAVFNNEAQTIHCTREWVGTADSSRFAEDSFLDKIMKKLLGQGIGSILVEGGKRTIEQFIQLNVWDEMRVFTSDNLVHKGLKAPELNYNSKQQIRLEADVVGFCFNQLT
jgi:diaminohydroxyphosphoribosylaminopyrimidine deaminase/5-amino-6-(5-phosphoribosylamino)uracil reductase